MKTLEYGDQSLVGEKGYSLSGGQKARINLARYDHKYSIKILFLIFFYTNKVCNMDNIVHCESHNNII